MSCVIFYSTEMAHETARVSGSPPRGPMRWAVDYVVKTPDGRTVIQNTKTIQHATFEELRAVMDHTIGEIGDEVGNVATFVSWRASTHGGTKKHKRKKR